MDELSPTNFLVDVLRLSHIWDSILLLFVQDLVGRETTFRRGLCVSPFSSSNVRPVTEGLDKKETYPSDGGLGVSVLDFLTLLLRWMEFPSHHPNLLF